MITEREFSFMLPLDKYVNPGDITLFKDPENGNILFVEIGTEAFQAVPYKDNIYCVSIDDIPYYFKEEA